MKNFLTCHWENLLYVNFIIDPKILIPFLPEDVEPSLFKKKTIISFVCFEFSKAKFFGFKAPFNQYFPEINLRVYVQKKDNPNLNGVYFISEMVPKLMPVFVAKYFFGEPFSLQKIKKSLHNDQLRYFCNSRNLKLDFSMELFGNLQENFSEEEKFVIDREYAFCGKKGKSSTIFRVAHKKWMLIETKNPTISIHRIQHIPKILQEILLNQNPSSSFVTNGSYVETQKIFNV